MLGCFNSTLGQIWTSLSIFDPKLGLNNSAFLECISTIKPSKYEDNIFYVLHILNMREEQNIKLGQGIYLKKKKGK